MLPTVAQPFTQIALIASLALATVASANVIGADGRRPPGPDQSELASAVGHIVCSRVVDNRRRFAGGTGTVVGSRNTILTSAHVLVDEAGRSGPRIEFDIEADCAFRQYDSDGNLLVEVGFSQWRLGEFSQNAGAPNQDWAVLRTAAPLPESTTPIAFAALRFEDLDGKARLPIEILAFHADFQAGRRIALLSEGMLFSVNYAGFDRLAHTADTGRMSSGAAIVHRTTNGQNLVVGVNRSGANFGDFNLAVPLTAELVEALSSFAYGQVPLAGLRLAGN
jgi:hypothetical protein